jgi:hypothetical protein
VCLPLVAQGASLLAGVEPGRWSTLSAPLRSGLAADGFFYTGACAIVAAPLVGVFVVAGQRHPSTTASRPNALCASLTLAIAVLMLVMTSGLVTVLWRLGQPDANAFAVQSHLILLAVTLALSSWGALCAAWCRNPLDAVALSLVTVGMISGGVLVAGGLVAELPQTMIELALIASPLVAVASGAHIDLVRMDVLYQISPLAHMRFDYPAWETACRLYLMLASGCFLGLIWRCRIRQSVSVTREE